MDVSNTVKYLTEFIGTAMLVLILNGTIASIELKGTKVSKQSWLVVPAVYGLAVLIPSLAFGNITAQFNPALTLGLAVSGAVPWNQAGWYILAQVLGAIVGQLIVVFAYRPYYLKTEDSTAILNTFATVNSLDDGSPNSDASVWINGIISEFFGTLVFVFAYMGLTYNFFGTQSVAYIQSALTSQAASNSSAAPSAADLAIQGNFYVYGAKAVSFLAIGFVVMGVAAAFGNSNGPALNPARDFGPRLLHTILPESVLGEDKGDSKWWYAWVPIMVPIVAAIAAVALFKVMYLK